MKTYREYASVVLEIGINKPLDYGIPDYLCGSIQRGMQVEVPVRGQFHRGYVLDVYTEQRLKSVRPISQALKTLITSDLFELGIWLSKYYNSSLGKVFKLMLPAAVRKQVKPKQQLFVMRKVSKEEMKKICESIRNRFPAQAAILDVMLQTKKGILLTELLEQASASKSSVDALAKKDIIALDIVKIDRSPLVHEEYFKTKPKKLNQEQSEALNKIKI